MVLRSQAESLLVRGHKDRAAQIYSCSDADFDMVILRILDLVPPIPSTSHLQGSAMSSYGTGAGAGVAVGAGFGGVHGGGVLTLSEVDSAITSPLASSSSAALLQYLLEKLNQLGQGTVSGLGDSEFNSTQVGLNTD